MLQEMAQDGRGLPEGQNNPGSPNNTKRKRDEHNTHQDESGQRHAAAPSVSYCLLCPAARIGSVIGKGGSVISRLRHETGARIKVEEAVAACDERVISITSQADPLQGVDQAQDALFRICRCIADTEEGSDPSNKVRLLVDRSQIGAVLGKGGSIITEMREKTGAAIRVLDKTERPLCARETDELIQVHGESLKVHLALEQILQQLRANPARPAPQKRQFSISASAGVLLHDLQAPLRHNQMPTPLQARMQGAAQMQEQLQHALALQQSLLGGQLAGFPQLPGGLGLAQGLAPGISQGLVALSQSLQPQMEIPQGMRLAHGAVHGLGQGVLPQMALGGPGQLGVNQVVSGHATHRSHADIAFRMLVPLAAAGSVIGRGGEVIKAIRQEMDARVKMHPETPDCEMRVVSISSSTCNGLGGCPAIDALVCCFQHANGDSSGTAQASARLLVPKGQIGAIIGLRGKVISQLRANSLATLKVACVADCLPGALPEGGDATDEVLLIEGPYASVISSLQSAAGLLLGAQVKNGSGSPSQPPRTSTPPSLLLHSPNGSPTLRGSPLRRTRREAGPTPMHASPEGPSRPSTPLTSTVTEHLSLTQAQASAIMGPNGYNITAVRNGSQARIKLMDTPLPGGLRELVLSGTREQVQSALNFIQCYLISAKAPLLASLPAQPFQ